MLILLCLSSNFRLKIDAQWLMDQKKNLPEFTITKTISSSCSNEHKILLGYQISSCRFLSCFRFHHHEQVQVKERLMMVKRRRNRNFVLHRFLKNVKKNAIHQQKTNLEWHLLSMCACVQSLPILLEKFFQIYSFLSYLHFFPECLVQLIVVVCTLFSLMCVRMCVGVIHL